jgi:inosose dehydratase
VTADQTTRPENKIAGAPISWGVCEVPGWGYQLSPDRVLEEMCELGLLATELGPEGFLPTEPAAMASMLSGHGLQAVGGFTPLLLHVEEHDPVPEVNRILEGYVASRARVLILSAVTGCAGYDTRPQLDEAGWKRLVSNLDRVAKSAAERGVRAVLHPHVGTMIETGSEVQQVLDGSSISLCLDTGHLLIGGTDPAELARQAPERIAHLHLKDVDSTVAAKVQSGQLTYSEAVELRMYRRLGQGDIDVPAIVGHVRAHGYNGWYTLEQDTILTEEPKDEGPVADVRASAEYLRTVFGQPPPSKPQ